MNTEKVTVSEFVKKYNSFSSDTLRDKYLKEIVKRTYCPVLEKRAILGLMLDNSVNDGNVRYIDMFVNRINFIAAIISLYTNIVPDKNEEGKSKSFEMYDLLVENNIFDKILNIIGERELGELTSINGVLLDTWHNKNSTTEAYISREVERVTTIFSSIAGSGLESLATVLSDDKKMDRILNLAEKGLSKIK